MNTHESYVSLETAKMLKEAGFDWACREYYYNFTTTGWSLSFDDDSVNWNSWSEQYISAPTLSVAQRWLREVKNIDINILADSISGNKKYVVLGIWFNISDVNASPVILDTVRYKSYEEAQEAGIKKALELILEKGE